MLRFLFTFFFKSVTAFASIIHISFIAQTELNKKLSIRATWNKQKDKQLNRSTSYLTLGRLTIALKLCLLMRKGITKEHES